MPAQTGRLMVKTHRQSKVVNKPAERLTDETGHRAADGPHPEGLGPSGGVGERLTDQRHRGRAA